MFSIRRHKQHGPLAPGWPTSNGRTLSWQSPPQAAIEVRRRSRANQHSVSNVLPTDTDTHSPPAPHLPPLATTLPSPLTATAVTVSLWPRMSAT